MMVNMEALLAGFKQAKSHEEKWDIPFPMAVFGTLRHGWTNHYLMGKKLKSKIQTDESTHFFETHHKAFLPHFVAIDLGLSYSKGSSAVCEVFIYDPHNWKKMIPRVDSLEGFSLSSGGRGRFYHRTLAWLNILPAAFQHKFFQTDTGRCAWGVKRDLEIPIVNWRLYPKVPCWIYSSLEENLKSIQAKQTSIIWDGVNESPLGWQVEGLTS